MSRLVFVFCIIGTLALIAVCVWFGAQYFRHAPEIKGRVVLLKGVEPPAKEAGTAEVRQWLNSLSGVTPGCLCALGKSEQSDADSALLFCVGFTETDPSCMIIPEKAGSGVFVRTSLPSDVGYKHKMIFLFNHYLGNDMVDPRTDMVMKAP
ncbi:MAG TPA: hypothetical protein PLN69_05225 [bacterium]|nr:hypothetical protein [bacterium]